MEGGKGVPFRKQGSCLDPNELPEMDLNVRKYINSQYLGLLVWGDGVVANFLVYFP